MSLQLTWPRRCSHRLRGRTPLLGFEHPQLEFYQRNLALYPHSELWSPFLYENGNREAFQPPLCAKKSQYTRKKKTLQWLSRKRSENIPEITRKETFEPKTWAGVLMSPIFPPPLSVSSLERKGLSIKSTSCANWIFVGVSCLLPLHFPECC